MPEESFFSQDKHAFMHASISAFFVAIFNHFIQGFVTSLIFAILSPFAPMEKDLYKRHST